MARLPGWNANSIFVPHALIIKWLSTWISPILTLPGFTQQSGQIPTSQRCSFHSWRYECLAHAVGPWTTDPHRDLHLAIASCHGHVFDYPNIALDLPSTSPRKRKVSRIVYSRAKNVKNHPYILKQNQVAQCTLAHLARWSIQLRSFDLWPIDHCTLFHRPSGKPLPHEGYWTQSHLHNWSHQATVVCLCHFSALPGAALRSEHHRAITLHLHRAACHFATDHHSMHDHNVCSFHAHGHGRLSIDLRKSRHLEK